MGKTAAASERLARPVPFRARPELPGARVAARTGAQARTRPPQRAASPPVLGRLVGSAGRPGSGLQKERHRRQRGAQRASLWGRIWRWARPRTRRSLPPRRTCPSPAHTWGGRSSELVPGGSSSCRLRRRPRRPFWIFRWALPAIAFRAPPGYFWVDWILRGCRIIPPRIAQSDGFRRFEGPATGGSA